MEKRKQIEIEDDTRKLSFAVLYMSIVVLVLFSFIPSA